MTQIATTHVALLTLTLALAACGDGPQNLVDAGLPDAAPVCDDVTLPRAAASWIGEEHGAFGRSGSDIAFDHDGNLVTVDQDGDLVRVASDGTRTTWLTHIVSHPRGMAYLSTGELVIADSGLGRVIKVYPNGETRILVPHLDVPNGVDVDAEDFVYVGEVLGRAVVRIDPETGAVETIAADLPAPPDGLAFAPGYRTLYIAGSGNGAVYAVARDDNGVWGPVKRVGLLPTNTDPCVGAELGDPCTTVDEQPGTCQPGEGDELTCEPVAAGCSGQAVGDPCIADGRPGTCVDDGGGGLWCRENGACQELEEGDECTEYGSPGICVDDGSGWLWCRPIGACDGLEVGDECIDHGSPGTCVDDGGGWLWCRPIGACDGLEVGDECSEYGTPGTCVDDGGGYLWCRPIGPCDGLSAGDPCMQGSEEGICEADGPYLYCVIPPPCDGLEVGDLCEEYGQIGSCADLEGEIQCGMGTLCDGAEIGDPCGEGELVGLCGLWGEESLGCFVANSCTELEEGASCELWSGAPGVCVLDWTELLVCEQIPPCEGASSGDACIDWGGVGGFCADDLYGAFYCQTTQRCQDTSPGDPCDDWGRPGLCAATATTGLYCATTNVCAGQDVGDPCTTPSTPDGVCQMGGGGLLFCGPVPPCLGKEAGDLCTTDWGASGVCTDDGGGGLYCQELSSCFAEGEHCMTLGGQSGICVDDGAGGLVCRANACEGFEAGDACTDEFGATGHCAATDGGLSCELDPPCQGKEEGAACVHWRNGASGTCEPAAGGVLLCQPGLPCEGKGAGDECTIRAGLIGACVDDGLGGVLWCEADSKSGALTALEADACGNVYVGDARTGGVWRFMTAGTTEEVAAQRVTGIPFARITGLGWGRGDNGWVEDTLYVAVAGGAEVVAIPLGISGRAIVQPLTTDTVPTTPPDDPEVDCLNLPEAPISITELDGPNGYHDVAFDAEGYLVGTDGVALVAVNREGSRHLFATGFGNDVQGMDWLADGSLIVASDLGIVKIAPTGGQVVLAPDIYAYGVTVGPDGMVYVADNAKVYRIDPDTAEVEVYLDPAAHGQSWVARTVSFDFDHSIMFVGAHGDSIYALRLDDNLDPIGAPQHFATVRPNVTWLDGLGTDLCGNLYVPVYDTSGLYRITPDGVTSLYYQFTFEQYGHGLEWGNGVGGYLLDALYLPQPYENNTVVEVVLGAPASPED